MSPGPASNETDIALTTPVEHLPQVGKRRAEALHRLGIMTAADLLKHLPTRHEYHAGEMAIGYLAEGTTASVTGEIANCRWVAGKGFGRAGKGRFQATLVDNTHQLDLVWFNARYLRDKLTPGMAIAVTGKVASFNGYRQMVNPKWQPVDPESVERETADEKYRPIYAATENLPSEAIEQIIAAVLPALLPQIEDHLGDAFRAERALPTLAEAYRMMHAPEDIDEPGQARRRLAYDELFMLQTALVMKREHTRRHFTAPPLRWSESIDRHIRDRFPFELTVAQDHVVREIAADLQREQPMNRLLQGDVGSGKTVVALYAMLMAVADRRQAVLMAPTELLAEQHYESITAMLGGSNVRIALLTGSLPPADRQSIRQRAEAGELDIIIGTQALLTESVNFADPAVMVIDEQHRFGVVQRAQARAKSLDAALTPHTLVMTATPIPRTLSLTLFGDLDVSTIAGLPPGRQPIDTRVVGPDKRDTVYEYLASRVAAGEQLYVVVPAVEEGEANLTNARDHAEHLQQTRFADKRVAAVHGQLKRTTREAIMHRFRNGTIDALVATTVIEVGVDVPNASLMVVEHAERFGLAQLHQLRGRVGRGSTRSLCVFIGEPTTDDATARLNAVVQTTDGFAIAEHDLQIRGMGELVGTRQSGLPPLRVAAIPDDMDLLRLARRDAQQVIAKDPQLATPDNTLLRKRLVKQFKEALGLGDVA
jgi:ATP-dependent DNA helicase RecG